MLRRGASARISLLIDAVKHAVRTQHVFGLAVLLVVASGCNRPSVVQMDDGVLVLGEHAETSALQRGVTIGARTLTIESETGGITITGTNATEATLRFTITGRGDSPQAAKAQIDKLVVEESGDDQTYRYNVIPDKADLTVINIDGQIPRNASLRLVLRNGDVTLTNVEGTIEVEQQNGSIVYLGGSESVKLSTSNGDIFADFYRLGAGSRVDLAASNGDVSLGLPETANATIDARTRAGTVSVHDLQFADRRLGRKGAGAVFKAKLGNGAAQTYLNTLNGSITFSRVSLSALPNDEPALEPPGPDTTQVPPLDPDVPTIDTLETIAPQSSPPAQDQFDSDTSASATTASVSTETTTLDRN